MNYQLPQTQGEPGQVLSSNGLGKIQYQDKIINDLYQLKNEMNQRIDDIIQDYGVEQD